MTQRLLDFGHEEDCAPRHDDEDVLWFPEISYVSFDDYQDVVTEFYAAQEQMRAELPKAKVSADLIAAWDRAKSVR